MESILFKKVDFDLNAQKELFEQVFDLITVKLGDAAFTRFTQNGEPTGRLAPAYYEATACAFATCFESIRDLDKVDVRDKLQRAYSDARFLASTGPGANTIPKLEQRIKVVAEYFV